MRPSEGPKRLKLEKIAELIGGELIGDREILISGAAGIKDAREGDITFLSNPKYLSYLEETQASAVITSPEVTFSHKALIRTANPSRAFDKVLSLFALPKEAPPAGVHPAAVVHASARLGSGVSVGPHAVIEKDCVIGDRTIVGAGVFVGVRSAVGKDCLLYPNVTLREETRLGDRVIVHSGAVIGSDGFGFETVEGRHVKIPQTGCVQIDDDVEIGANVCIDRGRFQKTWVKRGVKIDNLVQIAHNVVIGEDSMIVSQAGISGSTELGDRVVIAGQAGIVGHLTIGSGAVIAAGAGVTKSVAENTVVLGSPAKPISEQKKIFALIARLPELFKELSEIKKKLER